MTPPASAARRCWAAVDLDALGRNVKRIRASLPPRVRFISVVKADAYGHGLPEVAKCLIGARVDLFAVANVAEAVVLREAGAECPILVLSALVPGEDRCLAEYDLNPMVSSIAEVARFGAVGKAVGRPIAVHVKIDTGMGRLGVWHEEAPAVFRAVAAEPGVVLAGICTHFASSDDDPEFTAKQREIFLATINSGMVPHCGTMPLLIHADNSGGLESLPAGGPFNAVRVGLMQFGISPHPLPRPAEPHIEPVMSFRTRVGLVKKLPRGATVSYGRTNTLLRDSQVAILCAGYGDGVMRSLGNRAQVLVRGRRCPILGRVTMDQTMVDVTDAPGAATGDEAVFFGRQGDQEITATEFSHWAGTIPWESLCAITKRVPRIYS